MEYCACVKPIFDFVFPHVRQAVVQEFNYLMHLEENICSLTDEMADLKLQRGEIQTRVDAEERKSLKRTPRVDHWLKAIEAVEGEASTIGASNQKGVVFLEYCSPGCWWSSYKLGKSAAEKLAKVRKLKSDGAFDVVAEEPSPEQVVGMPIAKTVGMDSTMATLRCLLRDSRVGIVGIYGPGGVGKTTLLRKFNNELLSGATWNFDMVIFIVVSNTDLELAEDSNVDKVQKELAKRLQLPWEEDESRESRAQKIFNGLNRMKFTLLLDDVWKTVDLEAVGVPLPTSKNECKVVLTTRSEDVCGDMGMGDNKIEVKCLGKEEAWELFIENAGQGVINSHRQILPHAEEVVKACGGLPLALIVVGRAMASKKTVEEWRNAATTLRKWPTQMPGMEQKVLTRLKFSYDNLPDDTMRKCFLYCCLFPEDYSINKEELIHYWIGEGFLDEYDDLDEACDKGHELIGRLKAICLLESGDDPETKVKMHDVIRDLALWIVTDCEKQKNKYLVHAGVGLTQVRGTEKWKESERISLMDNEVYELTETPDCPDLLTLMLQWNWSLDKVSDGFFQCMPILRVLNLSNTQISVLPASIGNLTELRYLNLSRTLIHSVPTEVGELVKLRHLDLSNTYVLTNIPSEVISRLSNLQVLMLYSCEYNVDDYGFEALESLEQLRRFDMSIMTADSLERFLRSHRLPNLTQRLELSNGDFTSLDASTFRNLESLRKLYITNCSRLLELALGTVDAGEEDGSPLTVEVLILYCLKKLQIRWQGVTAQTVLRNLIYLSIYFCPNLKNITWVIRLPFLESIHLRDCYEMEQLIDDIGDEVVEEEEIAFPKLKWLDLCQLSELKSICSRALHLPSLVHLNVSDCPQLKKLPLGAHSAKKLREIWGSKEWWDGIEWDECDVRSSFLPFFKIR